MKTKFEVGDDIWVSNVKFITKNYLGCFEIKILLSEKKIDNIRINEESKIMYYLKNNADGLSLNFYEEEVFGTREEALKVINRNIFESFSDFILEMKEF